MSDIPERIKVYHTVNEHTGKRALAAFPLDMGGIGTEYVRADLVDEIVKKESANVANIIHEVYDLMLEEEPHD